MARLKGLAANLFASQYQKALKNKNYAFFESGDYNLNIIGVRSSSGNAAKFDDLIAVIYKVKKEWVCDVYPITSEPSAKILRVPLKEVAHKGTAILVPDQYRGTYKVGWHGNKDRGHTALVQRCGKVRVFRDNDRNSTPDYHAPEEEGWFGINIHKHRGSDAMINTGGVSAGCQVFQSSKDFSQFMKTCEIASKKWGNKFTYTLLEEKDL